MYLAQWVKEQQDIISIKFELKMKKYFPKMYHRAWFALFPAMHVTAPYHLGNNVHMIALSIPLAIKHAHILSRLLIYLWNMCFKWKSYALILCTETGSLCLTCWPWEMRLEFPSYLNCIGWNMFIKCITVHSLLYPQLCMWQLHTTWAVMFIWLHYPYHWQ